MYDTLILNKPNEGTSNNEFVPSLLYSLKEHRTETNLFYSGYIGNGQQVLVYPDRTIFKGSIAKFYHGDNIKTIGRGDSQRAIEKLSDTLKMDFTTSKVSRLDVGLTIPTDFEPRAYYPLLGASGQFKRNLYKNSLYYFMLNKENIFYDKIKDARKKGMIIPDWLTQHLLRFEIKLLKKLATQLNMNQVLAKDLYSEVLYMQLLDRWLMEYNNVKKLSYMELDSNSIKKPTDLVNQMIVQMLMSSGVDVPEMIDSFLIQAKEKKVFNHKDRKNYTRSKDMIYDRLQVTEKDDMIKELDTKFKNQIQFYR
jgi:hypothetical protein